MGEGLLRQRRNLMVTCILLWAMKYGGVTFTKLSLVGFDVEFKNPHALILSIWIAFAYFLYRYYQYFSVEGTANLKNTFRTALELKCEPIISQLVKKQFPNNNDNIRYSYGFLKRDRWIYKGQAIGSYDTSTGSASNEQFELEISRWQLRKGILSAILDSVFRNSVVTDYLLPFFFAGFILYYCGANDWSGSFLRL